jgi:hypothetical protein
MELRKRERWTLYGRQEIQTEAQGHIPPPPIVVILLPVRSQGNQNFGNRGSRDGLITRGCQHDLQISAFRAREPSFQKKHGNGEKVPVFFVLKGSLLPRVAEEQKKKSFIGR